MFITITLNPAIDTMIHVEKLNIDKQTKIISKQKVPGGKGINISKVLKDLGEKTFATGLLGGTSGKMIEKELSLLKIDHRFIHIDGETRENIHIFDHLEKKAYEIYEVGPSCDMNHFHELIIFLKSIIKSNDVVVISGSAPFDVDVDVYKVLIQQIKGLVSMVVLDTSKDWFKEGLSAIPDLVKPNLAELEQYTQKELKDEKTIIQEGLKICKLGVKEVLISLGDKGSLYVSPSHIYKISNPFVEVKKTVGAGDALLAGYISSKPKLNLTEALKRASAISLAYISERKDIDHLQKLVEIKDMKA